MFTQDQKNRLRKIANTAQTVGSVGGGIVGGSIGSVAGGAIGTALLPGIGTAIGSTLGSMAGGMIGDMAGGKIGGLFSKKKPTTPTAPQRPMQTNPSMRSTAPYGQNPVQKAASADHSFKFSGLRDIDGRAYYGAPAQSIHKKAAIGAVLSASRALLPAAGRMFAKAAPAATKAITAATPKVVNSAAKIGTNAARMGGKVLNKTRPALQNIANKGGQAVRTTAGRVGGVFSGQGFKNFAADVGRDIATQGAITAGMMGMQALANRGGGGGQQPPLPDNQDQQPAQQ